MKQTDIVYAKGNTTFTFLETGDIFDIQSNGMMINQLNGNVIDGSLNQLYLRVYQSNEIVFTPMIGSNSKSKFIEREDSLQWEGQFLGVYYIVTFHLSKKDSWFWDISLSGEGQIVDVIYGQDLGNALTGAVRSNEAYMSQYLDHHISEIDEHIVISSRQNQSQGGKYPLVEQGALTKTISFSTDGYQFFGKSYKETNTPEILNKEQLKNEVYQYEFAYTALQTEKMTLNNQGKQVTFYGLTKANQEEAVTEPVASIQQIQTIYDDCTTNQKVKKETYLSKQIGKPLVGQTFTEKEINELFPNQKQVEQQDGQLLSFFTDKYHHVVLKEKELLMERTHGHILLSGTDLDVDIPLMSTTLYMTGIFNSQVVLGNTSMNKLMSNSRNALNLIKQSGQRIYVKKENQWRILTVPSAFEMGLNSATWYYKLEDDLLKVTTYSITEAVREIRTEVHSQKGKTYSFLITNQLIMDADELSPAFELTQEGETVKIRSTKESAIQAAYPELTYYFNFDKPYLLTDESVLLAFSHPSSLTAFLLEDQSEFVLSIQGSLEGQMYKKVESNYKSENQAYLTYINGLLNGFELDHATTDVNQMNTIARWYVHNMLVHYLSPHGLEQYGGAAWGTRDVSQGPTEFFLAANRPDVVGSIIKHVYENQFEDKGNWPQWFMFDRYEEQKADESHGDVIVWPMKIVADYLKKTHDFTILDEQIAYTQRGTFRKTAERYTLLEHIKKEVSYIENNFLEGTYLSCYGDGDWDDTLQPYDSNLKKYMASSWTIALTYQVLKELSELIGYVDKEYSHHLGILVENIKVDYDKYILNSETIPGFVYMQEPGKVERIIHPEDKKTGIQYRLLPMTRGMIAEMLTPEQVGNHLSIIKEYLQFPDGVRLMNRPANYQGGVSTNFKRAEQSANFGREIGLQYVHAHIRFAEAMAKIGETTQTWKALTIINPIQLSERVHHAALRQSNVYFSSSDGDFKTRYEAQSNFGKLRDGSVPVKGGWRIYSSGPGIYLGQLISSVLGLRQTSTQVTFDPILPKELDGLKMSYRLFEKEVQLAFHLNSGKSEVVLNNQTLHSTRENNPYRTGGLVVSAEEILSGLNETNQLEIYC
ncbi:hypothetical protein IGI37_002911 [Enterococcus sp. AZ194]|uniref:GH36-type glycosyl hydrolase domain-containing protein n=1 Tax=Enterococcus sp. AZ194 TaxID=2774629 RepID=UPI003F29CD51